MSWSPHNKIINVTPGPAFGSELVTQFTSTQTRGMRGPGVAKFFTTVREEYGKMVGLQEGGKALFFTGSGTSATESAAGSLPHARRSEFGQESHRNPRDRRFQ